MQACQNAAVLPKDQETVLGGLRLVMRFIADIFTVLFVGRKLHLPTVNQCNEAGR